MWKLRKRKACGGAAKQKSSTARPIAQADAICARLMPRPLPREQQRCSDRTIETEESSEKGLQYEKMKMLTEGNVVKEER